MTTAIRWDRMIGHIVRLPNGRTLQEDDFRQSELTIWEYCRQNPPPKPELPEWWWRLCEERE